MKVIDLLNKIANGEEVPKKIKWENTIYAYSEYDKDYLEFPFSEEEYKGFFNMRDIVLTQCLYDQVEVIEEEKKIPEKLNLDTDELRGKETPRTIDYLIESKINQVIDYLKSKEE